MLIILNKRVLPLKLPLPLKLGIQSMFERKVGLPLKVGLLLKLPVPLKLGILLLVTEGEVLL